MEFNLITLIGISLGTMFFGYFFGLFEGRAQGYRKRRKEEPLDRQERLLTEKPAASPAPAPAIGEGGSQSQSWLELAGDDQGRPRMDLDGHRVDTARLTPAQHKRLVELMVMIRPWVEAPPPAAGARVPPELSESQSAPSTGAQRTSIPGVTAATGPTGVGPVLATAESAAASSLVVQIDTILQARLEGTPLAAMGIRLAESLDGGVIVFVGKQHYSGVADVPDARVQAAIRAAIAEWEKRYTPG